MLNGERVELEEGGHKIPQIEENVI